MVNRNKKIKNTKTYLLVMFAILLLLSIILVILCGALLEERRKLEQSRASSAAKSQSKERHIQTSETPPDSESEADGITSEMVVSYPEDSQIITVDTEDTENDQDVEDTEEPMYPENNEKREEKYIAIDAGHQKKGNNGKEPIGPGASTQKTKVSDGTAGVSTGIPEYQLNLAIAKLLEEELISRGYRVYMIRETNDVDISNIERAQMANSSGADIYIRLHADGADNHSTKGASALYPSESNPYVGYLSAESKRLSLCVLNAYCERTGVQNRGLSIRDDLTGTNWSEIPVTLIEMGFMSNREEDEQMQEESFQRMMAEGIADGIDEYYGQR